MTEKDPACPAYLQGWCQGVRFVERNYWLPRLCMSTARFLIQAQGLSDYGRGWADAILSGYGG